MTVSYTLSQLAMLTGAQLIGDGNIVIHAVASVAEASTGAISYIRDAKFRHFVQDSHASALILPPAFAEGFTGNGLLHADPYLIYAKVVTALHPVKKPAFERHPSAVIAESAQLGQGCSIGANVVIEDRAVLGHNVVVHAGCFIGENSYIGDDSVLHANVTVASDCQLGARCILQSGAIIGGDGFGFAPTQGHWYKIPQIGNVVLGDDVEVGANTTVDRASMGSTRVGNGTKLDNLIQVAHNVQIGEHCVIAGSTGIAGSTIIGNHCRIGGMCGISGHLTIVDKVTVTGRTFVASSIHKAGVYSSGTTADDNASWRKNATRFHQLDKLVRRVAELEKQLAALNNKDTD